MKRVWLFITVMCLTGCLIFLTAENYKKKADQVQSEVSEAVIRFHVRANSEKQPDQQVKMKVKKAVLSYLQPKLSGARSVEETKKLLQEQLGEIQQIAEQTLRKEEVDYGAEAVLKKEVFPQKSYGDCTFPAGVYEAVVIRLGSGQGHNWWCMLYPSLCFADETYGVLEEEKKGN